MDLSKKPVIIEGDNNELTMVEAHEKKLQERYPMYHCASVKVEHIVICRLYPYLLIISRSLMAAEASKNEMRKRIAAIRKEFNDVLQKNKEVGSLEGKQLHVTDKANALNNYSPGN